MSRERWAPVPGWGDFYQVSNLGRVRSLDREHDDHRGRWVRRGRVLKQSIDREGYRRVNLMRDGKRAPRTVHRLVLEGFVGPRPEGHQCRHLNGDAGDNRLENLAWGTPRENYADRRRHGRIGRRDRGRLLTRDQAREIRRRREAGERCKDLAAEFGVSGQLVSAIGCGVAWKEGTDGQKESA